jgi:hypothetical protein
MHLIASSKLFYGAPPRRAAAIRLRSGETPAFGRAEVRRFFGFPALRLQIRERCASAKLRDRAIFGRPAGLEIGGNQQIAIGKAKPTAKAKANSKAKADSKGKGRQGLTADFRSVR